MSWVEDFGLDCYDEELYLENQKSILNKMTVEEMGKIILLEENLKLVNENYKDMVINIAKKSQSGIILTEKQINVLRNTLLYSTFTW